MPRTYLELCDDDVPSASTDQKHSADDTNALTPTQSKLPDRMSMSPVPSSGTEFNTTLKDKARLLESDDAYVNTSVLSASSGLKRNAHEKVSQEEREKVEEKQLPKLLKSSSVKYEIPTYC